MNGAGGDFLFPWVLSKNALIPAKKRAVPFARVLHTQGDGEILPKLGTVEKLSA